MCSSYSIQISIISAYQFLWLMKFKIASFGLQTSAFHVDLTKRTSNNLISVFRHVSYSSPCWTLVPGFCLRSTPAPPSLPSPSWQYGVVGRLIEEVSRFVRQSNQSASHKNHELINLLHSCPVRAPAWDGRRGARTDRKKEQIKDKDE